MPRPPYIGKNHNNRAWGVKKTFARNIIMFKIPKKPICLEAHREDGPALEHTITLVKYRYIRGKLIHAETT